MKQYPYRRLIAAGAAICIIAASVILCYPSLKQAHILKACNEAVDEFAKRKSMELKITSRDGDNETITTVYYSVSSGQPRWYKESISPDGQIQGTYMQDYITYGKYIAPDSDEEVITKRTTDDNLAAKLPEYQESAKKKLKCPEEISSIQNGSYEKASYSSIRQSGAGQYEFSYSDSALENERQKRIAEAKQFEQWRQQALELEENLENPDLSLLENADLFLLTGRAAVRQAEETREIKRTEQITLDTDGSLKTIRALTAAEVKAVMPDLETGEIRVSEEVSTLEGDSTIEVVSVDDPSVDEFLDGVAASLVENE